MQSYGLISAFLMSVIAPIHEPRIINDHRYRWPTVVPSGALHGIGATTIIVDNLTAVEDSANFIMLFNVVTRTTVTITYNQTARHIRPLTSLLANGLGTMQATELDGDGDGGS